MKNKYKQQFCGPNCCRHVSHPCDDCGRYQGYILQELLEIMMELKGIAQQFVDASWMIEGIYTEHWEKIQDKAENILADLNLPPIYWTWFRKN